MIKNQTVLDYLRRENAQFVSGEEVSRKLKVSRSAIWKEIQSLRRLGYEIEAHPHLGYRLSAVPDKLFPDEIRSGLATQSFGKDIYSYESLDSTNAVLLKLADQGAREGTCVFAEYQKSGRGRLGRTWISPPSQGLLGSILLRPALSPSQVSKITLCCAVSIVKCARRFTGAPLGIKWPNDILHGQKKVGGILTEISAEQDRVKFVVVGLGLNINSNLNELPEGATSLKAICGEPLSRIEFTRQFLTQFEKDYSVFRQGQFDLLAREWEEFSLTSGKRVTVSLFNRKITGMAVGIDADGALWIRKDNGLQERVLSGDVTHVR